MNKNEYEFIIVESFIPQNTTGRHGTIHIRPLPGQDPYLESMFVECSKDLSYSYPLGTKFRIKAKIVSKVGSTAFIYSHYLWSYDVLKF